MLTGVFLSSLDLFIVNIAFPSISESFHGENLSSLSWVLSAYTIVFAAALVPAGRWADRSGRKRAFLLGLAIFTVSSALCALAPSLGFLVGARVLQATGGALMLPTSLGLLLPAFGPERKGAAIGLWSAVGGAAAAFGPPIGGLLVQASWRWVFLVNLPFSVLALVFGVRELHEVRDPAAHRSDLLGAALLSVSVASLVAAIVEGTDWGWDSPRILGAFALAAVSGAWLVARSWRHPNPILEPAVIRHRAVALADISSLAFFCGFGALVLGGVLFLTGVWHESVLRAGFLIAPGPLLAGLTAFPGRHRGRSARPPGRRHARLALLRRRRPVVGGPRRRRPRLPRRLPPGQPAQRIRRRAHAALARAAPPRPRCRPSASPPARPSTPCRARSGSPSAWPAWSPSWARPPVRRRCPPSTTRGSS